MFEIDIQKRMDQVIKMAWFLFQKKDSGGLISVNKEASMQLQYSIILSQLINLIRFEVDEEFIIDLETGMNFGNEANELDLLFCSKKGDVEFNIAIEMKCYRKIASSGGNRGATDIFMKDVYEDIALVERYQKENITTKGKPIKIHKGYVLVMNDLQRLVEPEKKDGKCWAYDISDGFHLESCSLETPIGGKSVEIKIQGSYKFQWEKQSGVYYLLLESSV